MMKFMSKGFKGQKFVPRTWIVKVSSSDPGWEIAIFSLNWSVKSLLKDISIRIIDSVKKNKMEACVITREHPL